MIEHQTLKQMEDCAILERVHKGDMTALGEIYKTYHSEFLGMIHKKFPKLEKEDIEDLYTDTIVSLSDNIQAGKISCESLTSSLKTYTFQIGINKTLARLKKENRFGNFVQEILKTTDEFEEFDNLVEEEEVSLKHMYKCMVELGDPCKTLLELHYYAKRRMNEIASVLGYKNADVAKNQKSKCMKRLRKNFVDAQKQNGNES